MDQWKICSPQKEEENSYNYYRNQEKVYYNNYQKKTIQYNDCMQGNDNDYIQYGRDRQRLLDERKEGNYQGEEQEPK